MVHALLLAVALSCPTAGADWQQIHKTADLVVYSRPYTGSAVNEMRAVGVVDASADALWNVVSDVERHTELLPNTTKSTVVRTDGDARIAVQRTETPLLDPREYVIAVRTASHNNAAGQLVRTMCWRTAPRYRALLDPDAVHIELNAGCWTVEAMPDGRSQITFELVLDPAGNIPASFVNAAQGIGAEKALAVLSSAARKEKLRA